MPRITEARAYTPLYTMLTLLFWNIQRKNLGPLIADMVHTRQVDVLMLAESGVDPVEMLGFLNRDRISYFHFPENYQYSKIQMYTKFDGKYFMAISGDRRSIIMHMTLPGRIDLIVAATHLQDKMHFDSESQTLEAIVLSKMLLDAEEEIGHSRTILIGDFNMSPFESGMIRGLALNAVISKEIAKKQNRMINGRKYKFFYNPMWNLLGDASGAPPGTYYHQESDHRSHYWYMMDQVLIRPDILQYFNNEDLEIITGYNNISFLRNGQPDTRNFSDHLPIQVRINL